MNPHQKQPTSLISAIHSSYINKALIVQMVKRDLREKYNGSLLGFSWSFITPILMLLVYTFVFSVVFNARWPVENAEMSQSKSHFAVFLFVGLLVHTFFAEIINSSTTVISNNVNLVKKVVFPLEILSEIKAGVALFNFSVGLIVLLLALLILDFQVNLTFIYIPIVMLPLLLMALGLSWFISSLGVYVKDISQPISIIITVMLFLSPVFFPLSAIPEDYRPLIALNPLTPVIEEARNVLILGKSPDFLALFLQFALSICIFWLGYAWFQKTRKGFADVI